MSSMPSVLLSGLEVMGSIQHIHNTLHSSSIFLLGFCGALAREVYVRRNAVKYSFLLLRKFRERQEEGTKCVIKTGRCAPLIASVFP